MAKHPVGFAGFVSESFLRLGNVLAKDYAARFGREQRGRDEGQLSLLLFGEEMEK